MTATPFAPVPEPVAGQLTLLGDDGIIPTDNEYDVFLAALRDAADRDGVVRANALRPLVRGRVKPNRIGPFTRRAVLAGVIRPDGWEVSDDLAGKNSGKPARCYRLNDPSP